MIMTAMKRLNTGYHTLCAHCVAEFQQSSKNLDMHVRKHGAPERIVCANCETMRDSSKLATYRVWYRG